MIQNDSPYVSEELGVFQKRLHRYIDEKLKPIANSIDEKHEFPAQVFKDLANMGIVGLIIPEEYGGTGSGWVSTIIAMEEISRASAAVGMAIGASGYLSAGPIVIAGSEEIKKTWLPGIASGDIRAAFALSEPDAGSNVRGIKTTIEMHSDRMILNGSKVFITASGISDVMLVIAKKKGGHDAGNFAMLIADSKSNGVTIRPIPKLGMNAVDSSEVSYQDVEVPMNRLVSCDKDTFRKLMLALNGDRLLWSAIGLGICQGAFEEGLNYSKNREAFGAVISSFQAIQFMLVEMLTSLTAARHMLYHAGWVADSGKPFAMEASLAKIFVSEACMEIARKAFHIHGGYGYSMEFTIQRFFREALVLEIGEGTTEVQKMIVARQLGLITTR
jgi:butyryl-CoA dehydrogenase